MIYDDLKKFPTPRMSENSPADYSLVWKRLHNNLFPSTDLECLFLLINNKLPVQERLNRIGVVDSLHCLYCPGSVINDVTHYFTSCLRTERVWSWIRTLIAKMIFIGNTSDWELLNLLFPRDAKDGTVTWIIGTYIGYVWQRRNDGKDFNFDNFFGFLTFKYKESKNILGQIQGLD